MREDFVKILLNASYKQNGDSDYKASMFESVKSFWEARTNTFYTSQDVKMFLNSAYPLEPTPDLTTIRAWMKHELNYSFRKVSWRPLNINLKTQIKWDWATYL